MQIAHDNRKPLSAYEQDYLAWYKGKSLSHAHAKTMANRKDLEATQRCGCIRCERVIHPTLIIDWIPDQRGDTAECPFCGIDAILPVGVGFPVTAEFISQMKRAYFE
ncbi:MAG: hypothetical protein KA230_06200 [Flavobacteriales bacterium]|nr:hypothetical protein [Flavobacteriales bacterium]